VTGDGHDAINGDVMADAIRRLSGEPGSADCLIEIPLLGYRYVYHVRIDSSGPAPSLVELRIVSDDSAEIDPATVRQIPVRRLANAAARFISLTGYGIVTVGDLYDQTVTRLAAESSTTSTTARSPTCCGGRVRSANHQAITLQNIYTAPCPPLTDGSPRSYGLPSGRLWPSWVNLDPERQ